MYDKHTNTKVEYQIIIDNKIAISFNTEKKRKEIIKRLKGTRNITCISDAGYPWNPDDGIHNLVSASKFAEHWGIKDLNKVVRAIKNGKLQTEKLGDELYIVNVHDHYLINGILHYKVDREA